MIRFSHFAVCQNEALFRGEKKEGAQWCQLVLSVSAESPYTITKTEGLLRLRDELDNLTLAAKKGKG